LTSRRTDHLHNVQDDMTDARAVDDADGRLWDVAIIGSGIGGGTAALALARSGKSVILLERGRLYAGNPEVIHNDLESRLLRVRDAQSRVELFKNAGRLWDVIDDITRASPISFQPHLGNAVGGSSSVYGMAFERFHPQDFSPGDLDCAAAGANVPAQWPIAYADLAAHYPEAERLYRVRGTPDPLGARDYAPDYLAPPPLSPANAEIVALLRTNGLHPYHQPMACEYVAGCRECLGFICPANCKGDSYSRCVEPAIRDFGAQLLDDCEVVHLEANRTAVTAVHCNHRGILRVVKARTVVLSAGALQTPALLLRSRSDGWPDGLANRHDQVGRNLMKHFIDYYFVRPTQAPREGELTKQISFNDFYVHGTVKLGNVQSLGPTPSGDAAARQFEKGLSQTRPRMRFLLPLLRPFARQMARRIVRDTLVFAGILEDLPYAENRVTYDCARQRICLAYHIHDEARRRIAEFRSLCLAAFRPLPTRLVRRAHDSWILGHQVGTCRFGTSPRDSVLDRFCRAHELDNLFVVDGSFMPTSGGINPSLTIAANALRVAAAIGSGS